MLSWLSKRARAFEGWALKNMVDQGTDVFEIVVVTGLSGAGKTSALKALEDAGYDAVDNLPVRLLPQLVPDDDETVRLRPLAVGMDSRMDGFDPDKIADWVRQLKARPELKVTLLFLDCSNHVLGLRFTETRRLHPLAIDRPVADGIIHERRLLSPLRDIADPILDTTDYSLTQLREAIANRFHRDGKDRLVVTVTSFSFRHGVPREADMVMDVRFLKNPYWDQGLREKTGEDQAVQDYIEKDPAFSSFYDHFTRMLDDLIPRYGEEGKSYLTIALGCTGGRHRSVHMAIRVAAHLETAGHRVVLRHKNLPDKLG